MTAVNIDWGPLADPQSIIDGTDTLVLNDADNSCGTVVRLPKLGIIDKIGVNVTEFTGAPPQYRVGLVTVDTFGNPTTTGYGGSAEQLWQPTGTGMVWITLSTPATVVNIGDVVCARIRPGNTAPDASNHIHVLRAITIVDDSRGPHNMNYQITWSVGNGVGIGAAYSDNSVALPLASGTTTGVFGNDHSPNEWGCLFQVPFDCICIGAKLQYRLASATNSDFSVRLYDASNTVLAQTLMDVSQLKASTDDMGSVKWAPVNLTRNTNYRLAVAPTSANHISITQLVGYDSASRLWLNEGSRWQSTTRTGAGSWSQQDANLPMMCITLSDIILSSTPTPGTSTILSSPYLGVVGVRP